MCTSLCVRASVANLVLGTETSVHVVSEMSVLSDAALRPANAVHMRPIDISRQTPTFFFVDTWSCQTMKTGRTEQVKSVKMEYAGGDSQHTCRYAPSSSITYQIAHKSSRSGSLARCKLRRRLSGSKSH